MPYFYKMKFKKIEGSSGITVYFEHLPDVRSVSMSWTMFVGSADDESVGSPGLYHWFEHVPFRGTSKYPGGYTDTKGYISRHGGSVGAYTSTHATTYHAHVPVSIWREALSTITDLMAQPLMTDTAIYAERDIILQEITRKKASLRSFVTYELPGIIWKGHPFGHPVLGNEKSLASMNPSILRKAQEYNYDRSRCALFVSGNLDEKKLLSELDTLVPLIQKRGLSPRHSAASYGVLPVWQRGVVTSIKTEHELSIVLVLFPIVDKMSLKERFRRSLVEHIFGFGGLDSPLYKVLREERKLVYSAEIIANEVPGGGYWGFYAETRPEDVNATISAIKDLIQDPEIISEDRLNTVKAGLRGSFDIRPIDPDKHRSYTVQRVINTGIAYSDEEYLNSIDSIRIEEIREAIQKIDPNDAHIVIFRKAL